MDKLREFGYTPEEICESWLFGIWLLIGLAPIILPILMFGNYIENYSESR